MEQRRDLYLRSVRVTPLPTEQALLLTARCSELDLSDGITIGVRVLAPDGVTIAESVVANGEESRLSLGEQPVQW